MTRLDDLRGRLSVRSINILKRKGIKYWEQVTPAVVESIAGKKTRQEIKEFIERRLYNC